MIFNSVGKMVFTAKVHPIDGSPAKSKSTAQNSFMLYLIEEMYAISKYAMLLTFSFSLKYGIAAKRFNQIQFFLFGGFYFFLCYYNWFYTDAVGIVGGKSKLFTEGIRVLISVSFFAALLIVINAYFGRHALWRMIKEYETIENDVKLIMIFIGHLTLVCNCNFSSFCIKFH